MKYVATTEMLGLKIPIFIGELDGAYAMTKTSKVPFDCGDGIKSKYQLILDTSLLIEEDDFVKYIFYHEIGHIEIFLKYLNGEIPFYPQGSFKEELFCDVYSLKTIGKYNLDFIEYIRTYEEPMELQKKLNRYMKIFLTKNIYNNTDDILKINFSGIK